jgi:hypothetical protein
MLDQLPNMRPGWANVTVTALVVSLVFAVVAAIVGRWVRIADISFAAVYLIALVSWPFAVVDVSAAPSDSYWLYYIMTIATAMATVGTDIRFATVYATPPPRSTGPSRPRWSATRTRCASTPSRPSAFRWTRSCTIRC